MGVGVEGGGGGSVMSKCQSTQKKPVRLFRKSV